MQVIALLFEFSTFLQLLIVQGIKKTRGKWHTTALRYRRKRIVKEKCANKAHDKIHLPFSDADKMCKERTYVYTYIYVPVASCQLLSQW